MRVLWYLRALCKRLYRFRIGPVAHQELHFKAYLGVDVKL